MQNLISILFNVGTTARCLSPTVLHCLALALCNTLLQLRPNMRMRSCHNLKTFCNCRLAYTATLRAFTSRAVAHLVTTLNTRVTTACPSRFYLINKLEQPCSSALVKSYQSHNSYKSCTFSSYIRRISGAQGRVSPQSPLPGISSKKY